MSNVIALRSQVSLHPVQKSGVPSPVPVRPLSFAEVIQYGFPFGKMDQRMKRWKLRNLRHLMRGVWRIEIAKKLHIPHLYGQLCLTSISPDGQHRHYGLVSLRMITTTGAGFVVDGFQGLVSVSSMKFHGIGTGSTPESASDSALVAELTTGYSPVNTRATGTQAEGSSVLIYRTIGFIDLSDTVTIAEQGIFNQAASGTGILLDRTVTASETFYGSSTIQSDYRLTVATGT